MNIYNKFKFNSIVKHDSFDSSPRNKHVMTLPNKFYKKYFEQKCKTIKHNKQALHHKVSAQPDRIGKNTKTMPNRPLISSIYPRIDPRVLKLKVSLLTSSLTKRKKNPSN